MTPYAGFAPVQEAVYAKLTGSASLMGMVSGVFDGRAPEGTAFPYILLGEAIETPDDAHGLFGRQTLVTLHVWSDYPGFAETAAIVGAVQELLDQQILDIAGVRHVSTRFEYAQTLVDPEDPRLRHAVVRFRVTTSEE